MRYDPGMAKVFDGIDDGLAGWIRAQRVFFVATAPRGDGGHINLSPKGPIDSLRILGPHSVAYLDLIGSGAETVAHLRDNGRIVLMFCAFEGPPRVVRLHGRGRAVQTGEAAFAEQEAALGFPEAAAARAIITVDVQRVSDSCGYGVPLLRYEGDRPQMAAWVATKRRAGPDALMDYVTEKNAASIDGLPALDPAVLPRLSRRP